MYDHYPKLYLRTKCNVNLSTEEFPLGFATHFEENEAFDRRRFTIEHWAVPYASSRDEKFGPFYIDNVPISGFRFEKSVSRVSTDNKWFRIQDPRGFTLEISSDNLSDIILNGELRQGLIVGNHVWVRHNSNNYLMRENDERLAIAGDAKTSGIVPGDIVSLTKITRATYIGEFFVTNELGYNYGNGCEIYVRTILPRKISKMKMFAYTDEEGVRKFMAYKSFPKYRIIGHDDTFDVNSFLNIGLVHVTNLSFKGIEFYLTKKEAQETPIPTADHVKSLFEINHAWYPNHYDVYYNGKRIFNGKKI